MRVISIANQKGGCGKTTTSINLASSLSFLGKRTLLIDLDPQGHSTMGLGYDTDKIQKSLYDVLSPAQVATSLEEIVLYINSNFHLVPSQIILSAIEQQLSGVYGREEKLMEKVLSVGDQYDYVIIDCPPNLGLLTFNALRASQELIVPVEPSDFSVQGFRKIKETVQLIEETLKHSAKVHVLLTMFNSNSNFNKSILAQLQAECGQELFNTVIHQNIKLKEAITAGMSICDFDRKSKGFHDYVSLASELIEKKSEIFLKEQKDEVNDSNAHLDSTLESEEEPLNSTNGMSKEKLSEEFEKAFFKEGSPEDPAKSEEESFLEQMSHIQNESEMYPVLEENGVQFGYLEKNAKMVQIAGDFNNWVNEAMECSDGEKGMWRKYIPLTPGKYRYKFIVDGEWMVDPNNNLTESNVYGGIDSVIDTTNKSIQETINERTPEI